MSEPEAQPEEHPLEYLQRKALPQQPKLSLNMTSSLPTRSHPWVISFRGLSNFAGAESEISVGSSVLNFATNGIGHEIAEACMEELRTQFRGDNWANNGPALITRVLNRTCNVVQQTSEMTPERCKGFTVYPQSTFYPIHWELWDLYFEAYSHCTTMAQLNKSMAIHVWNSRSEVEEIEVGSKQPYGLIAQKHCPKVYANCGVVF